MNVSESPQECLKCEDEECELCFSSSFTRHSDKPFFFEELVLLLRKNTIQSLSHVLVMKSTGLLMCEEIQTQRPLETLQRNVECPQYIGEVGKRNACWSFKVNTQYIRYTIQRLKGKLNCLQCVNVLQHHFITLAINQHRS